ncbi:nucleolin like 1 [Striga asiatica]|uniref:Nucleolin like 1 n=1 Tax=Striga asiatica TaxID=4170 RepID=A0A5A7NYG6_STRAF|nr:nucleolin like 1 [Striga asiatica]
MITARHPSTMSGAVTGRGTKNADRLPQKRLPGRSLTGVCPSMAADTTTATIDYGDMLQRSSLPVDCRRAVAGISPLFAGLHDTKSASHRVTSPLRATGRSHAAAHGVSRTAAVFELGEGDDEYV